MTRSRQDLLLDPQDPSRLGPNPFNHQRRALDTTRPSAWEPKAMTPDPQVLLHGSQVLPSDAKTRTGRTPRSPQGRQVLLPNDKTGRSVDPTRSTAWDQDLRHVTTSSPSCIRDRFRRTLNPVGPRNPEPQDLPNPKCVNPFPKTLFYNII